MEWEGKKNKSKKNKRNVDGRVYVCAVIEKERTKRTPRQATFESENRSKKVPTGQL